MGNRVSSSAAATSANVAQKITHKASVDGTKLHKWAARLLKSPQIHQKLFTDKVPTWDDWSLHRSAVWRHRMEPVLFVKVAIGFVWQLMGVIIIAVCVGIYHRYIVPLGAPPSTNQLQTPFNMMTFALSLLLVFKTNSSYSRWWEGRIIWGQIVNYGRNLPRLVLTYPPPPEYRTPAQRDLLRVAVRWMAAAPYVIKGHLRKQTYLKPEEEASHLLTPRERAYLKTMWANKPAGMIHVLSMLCCHRILGLTSQQQVSIQEQLTVLANNLGGCERIQRTAIPQAYTRHTSRFLLIYITLSPIVLWPSLGWATPVVAPLIAFLLLGTENIGVQIEEPFRVLPLDPICRGIEAGIRDMAAANLTDITDSAPWKLETAPDSVQPNEYDVEGYDVSLMAVLGLDIHPELNPKLGILGKSPATARCQPLPLPDVNDDEDLQPNDVAQNGNGYADADVFLPDYPMQETPQPPAQVTQNHVQANQVHYHIMQPTYPPAATRQHGSQPSSVPSSLPASRAQSIQVVVQANALEPMHVELQRTTPGQGDYRTTWDAGHSLNHNATPLHASFATRTASGPTVFRDSVSAFGNSNACNTVATTRHDTDMQSDGTESECG